MQMAVGPERLPISARQLADRSAGCWSFGRKRTSLSRNVVSARTSPNSVRIEFFREVDRSMMLENR